MSVLDSIFNKVERNDTPTIYAIGASFKDEDPNDRNGLVLATENNYCNGTFPDPAKFTVEANGETAIYVLRHVTALVVDEYVIFRHCYKGSTVYRLTEGKNTLVYYQFVPASIYGLYGSNPIALEHEEEIKIKSEEEWKDFIVAMVSSKMLDPEEAARINVFKTSSFD